MQGRFSLHFVQAIMRTVVIVVVTIWVLLVFFFPADDEGDDDAMSPPIIRAAISKPFSLLSCRINFCS